MEGRQSRLSATAEAAHQLKKAAGIGRNDGLGTHVEKVADFTIAKLPSGVRLQEVEDACRTTAKRGLGYLGHFKLGNFGEKLAGLPVDSLSMAQVACVVISDADR